MKKLLLRVYLLSNSPVACLLTKEVLPTPASPINTSLSSRVGS